MWHLHQAGLSSPSIFRDASNAFPSLNKDCLDQAVRGAVDGTNADLSIQRHRQTLLIILASHTEWLCVQPMTGDAQDDSCAAH
eukprot:3767976-Heterocapsa_arctica.AAC.1